MSHSFRHNDECQFYFCIKRLELMLMRNFLIISNHMKQYIKELKDVLDAKKFGSKKMMR